MFLSLLTFFLACEPKVEDTADLVDCTLDFRYSATIAVEDSSGNPLASELVEVSYTVNGVEGEYVEMWEAGNILVGGEEAGDFVVNITALNPDTTDECCWESASAVLEFTIEADECHVIPQEFDAELEWEMVCADSEGQDCG